MRQTCAQHRDFLRRAHHAVEAAFLREQREALHLRGGRRALANRGEVVVVEAGQHGDADDFGARAAARLDRGAHHRRAAAAMNGEQQRIEREAAFHRARHGVRDVVQLQIEEHVLLAGGGLADAVGPVRREEFEAELHAADRARCRGDQRLRARKLVGVDGAEDGVAIHNGLSR